MTNSEGQWHLDKKVNVTHMLGTAAIVVSLLSWAGAMDKRVTILETKEQSASQYRLELLASIKELNRKMDKLFESTNGR